MNSVDIETNSHLCNESSIHEDEDEYHALYKLMFVFFILFIGWMEIFFSCFHNFYFLKQNAFLKQSLLIYVFHIRLLSYLLSV